MSNDTDVTTDPAAEPELSVFTRRFAVLYDTQARPNGQPWTAKALTEALKRRGVGTTLSYVTQLRNGGRDNPNYAIINGLAKIFSVPVAYFFDGDISEQWPSIIQPSNAHKHTDINRMLDVFIQLSPEGRDEQIKSARARFRLEELERERADYAPGADRNAVV